MQFPNAYKIWLGKFDGTKDLGIFISNEIRDILIDKFAAWGRKSEGEKPSALFAMSYEDAAGLGGRAQSPGELAQFLGLKTTEFKSGVWLGRIKASAIADLRFPTADELGANEWWVPGLRVPANWFELVIARLENLRQLIADGTVTFEKLM